MLVNPFFDLCGAKVGRYSVICSFSCVFLLRLFSHLNEFWPKLGKKLQILAKTAFFRGKITWDASHWMSDVIL